MPTRNWFALTLIICFILGLLIWGAPDPFANLDADPGVSSRVHQMQVCRFQGGRWGVDYGACLYR
jgi:hypothetical protein